MIKTRVATFLHASPVVLRTVLPYAALLALVYMVGWAIVFMPALRVFAIVAGVLGALLWLLYPEVSVYILVCLFPYSILFNVGPLNDIRPQDGLLAVMMVTALASVMSGKRRETNFLRGSVPKALFALWLFVIFWDSIAFLNGPANQWLLKDPIRNAWYLYKDVWRDLLTFVVVAYFLKERHRTTHLLTALQVIATIIALQGIWQTLTTGHRAMGPFEDQPNQLAAVMILIIPYTMSRLLLESGWRQRILIGLSLLIMLRALWFTGSRGGFVACILSLWPLALMLPRKRLMAAGLAALVGLTVLIGAKPDILNRPVVKRYLTLTRPDKLHTLEWRKDQWRHFATRIAERPMLGTGSPVDRTIDINSQLQTAHNAYLGFALRSGIPITLAWICILVLAGAIAIRRGLTSVEGEERVFWIGTIGFTTALAVHAMNETALLTSPIQQLFWIVMAFIVVNIQPPKTGIISARLHDAGQRMSVIQRLVRNSLVYAVANALQKLTGFLLIPLYTRMLSVESYGVMELLATLTNSALILSTLGLSSALNKCYHRDCDGPEDQKRLTGTVIWLLTPTALAIAAAGIIWGAPISAWLLGDARNSELVMLAMISASLYTLSQIPLTLLRAKEASVTYSLLSLFQFLSMTGLNIWLVGHLRFGVRGVILGAIGSSIVVLLASVVYLLRHASFKFSPRLSRALLTFGLAMVPVAIAAWVMNVSDRWMLGFLASKEDVGLYGIGYRIGMIVQFLLVGPFQLAWPAFYFREAAKPEARDLYAKVFTGFLVVGGWLTLAISLGGEVILRIMAEPSYWPGVAVIPWVAASYFLNGCLYCVVPGVQLGGKTHLQPVISFFAAGANVLLNFLLIPRIGMIGAAVSTLLSFALAFALTAYLSRIAYGFKFGGMKPLRVVAVLAVAGMIGLAFQSESLFILALVRGLVLSVAALWAGWWVSREFGIRWVDRGEGARAWWKLTGAE